MKLFVGVIIVAIIVFIVLLASSFFGGVTDEVTDGVTDGVDVEKQSLDRLQEKINHCKTLHNDGGLQSPGVKCGIELIPELIEFCEKYPNSLLENSSCTEVLESLDELKRLESAFNP